MKALIDIPAPAKINLFLHITGRRNDGYHLLQSAFVMLDLCDSLSFEARSDGHISRTDVGQTASNETLPGNDLCIRAAHMLQAATGCRQGVHIELEKRIPTQAGLGGGSSDAASCLLALNKLWKTGLSRRELSIIGLQLGADVPFFIFGDNAWVEGIGEQLVAFEYTPQPFALLKPPVGLSTAEIFSAPELKRDTKPAIIAGFAEIDDEIKHMFGQNDLQPVAEARCPEIRQCVEMLKAHQPSARMTGSGSAVFAHWLPDRHLPSVPVNWYSRKCFSLQEHPLKHWA